MKLKSVIFLLTMAVSISANSLECISHENTSDKTIIVDPPSEDQEKTYSYYDEFELPPYSDFSVPEYSGMKSYMDYRMITDKTSDQYLLQQYASNGDFGIRMIDDRYCVAIGMFSDAEIGDKVDLILENGSTIQCIVGDFKNPIHTDANKMITVKSNCASEFIVSTSVLNKEAKKTGDISYCKDNWKSPVKTIRIYKEREA